MNYNTEDIRRIAEEVRAIASKVALKWGTNGDVGGRYAEEAFRSD
jgi:hypothetical protein